MWLGRFVVDSNWLFPVIESVHLLALSLLGGSILIVDMRLVGLGLTGRDVKEIAREARPFMNFALAMMIATGVPLFLSEPIKCYYSPAFWVKMWTLAIALISPTHPHRGRREWSSYTTQRAARCWSARCRLRSGSQSAAAGRWIGFS